MSRNEASETTRVQGSVTHVLQNSSCLSRGAAVVTLSLGFSPWMCLGHVFGFFLRDTLGQGFEQMSAPGGFHSFSGCPLCSALFLAFIFHSTFNSHWHVEDYAH